MIFSYAMSQLNSLTLTVLKANRARTAQPLRERNPFLPETHRTNKTTDTGVALTSNINTNFPKTLLTGSSKQQRHFINQWNKILVVQFHIYFSV